MTRKYRLAGIDCFLLQQDLASIAEPMEGFVQLNHFLRVQPGQEMQAFTPGSRRGRWDANIAAGAYDAVHFWAAAVEKAQSFDPTVSPRPTRGCAATDTTSAASAPQGDHQVVDGHDTSTR